MRFRLDWVIGPTGLSDVIGDLLEMNVIHVLALSFYLTLFVKLCFFGNIFCNLFNFNNVINIFNINFNNYLLCNSIPFLNI